MAESHGDAKGAAAHTEADGGHKAPFPPFQKDTFASQLVSLLIAFVALYLIVSRIALPRVGSVIDERQNKIEGDLADAQKLKDQSDSALKAYESELAAARSRAQAIGAETREKLNAASEAKAKMEDFVARRTKTAESKIALAEAQALADVRAAAANAAVTAASTILSQSVKGPVADDLLAKGIAEVRQKLN